MDNKFFMVYVEGGDSPKVVHTDCAEAEKEAKRLSSKLKKKAFVMVSRKEFLELEPEDLIKSFDDALKYFKMEPLTLPCDIYKGYRDQMEALYKLTLIARAWNAIDDFHPKFHDYTQQKKFFPNFESDYYGKYTYKCVRESYQNGAIGSNIGFKTKERAEHFGMRFESLFNDFFKSR